MHTPQQILDQRVHIIYQLTIGSETYIGVTAKTRETVEQSVLSRIAKHWYRAQRENRDWRICHALRKLDSRHSVEYRILACREGKVAAHRLEREMIARLNPSLNTDKRGM